MVPLSVTRVPASNRYLQPLPQQPDLGSSADLGVVSAGLSQPQLGLADPSAVLAEPASTTLGLSGRASADLVLAEFLQHDMINLQLDVSRPDEFALLVTANVDSDQTSIRPVHVH